MRSRRSALTTRSRRVIKKRFAGVNRLSFDMPVRNDHDRGVLKEILQDLRR